MSRLKRPRAMVSTMVSTAASSMAVGHHARQDCDGDGKEGRAVNHE